ncbi:MAG: tRNA (N6-isopentenyl adenosine(37)-C2)-methylthiotransferase MiaB, partial [Planctomycetes bacterium]|nr:tRNA (N6-isopentenyl adenosine(37)-C2)-methylthiotransferase MiaB [Planctomycetota bacterium]
MIAPDTNKVYLETMGCQMNKLDSELVQSQLIQLGYRMTDDLDSASVIIYNTCSVREHAEDKVISKITHLKRRHKQDKNLVLAVIGCMAQRRGQDLLKEYDYVDIVCGPGQIHQLGEMIQKNQLKRQPTLLTNNRAQLDELEQLDLARIHFDEKAPFSAYVRVIRGCSKFCHFCVVPFTRGLEHSRPIDNIYEESRRLVDQGVKEITLLGQTVNSYNYQNGKQYSLADVMERIHNLEGLERIRFVTSYPADFHDQIMQAIADLPKVCPYLHMPAQSGSDRILKSMNRRYSRSQYIDLVQQYRESVPGISIVGDIIVGYCGETEEDFEQTADLLETVRFKNNYIFQYSPRPKTTPWKDLPAHVP